MFVNVIKSCRDVVAVCDSDLLGKYFEEGDLQLDVKESFYKGEEVSYDEAVKIISNMANEDATFNIVGKESVRAGIEAGIISKEDVKEIQGISFCLVLM
ncbi:MAG: DUF424 family protein [Candidatus Pacearchaeota archaeon]|nr:DUF424 family protein [Candidatus Pacearchaeota archaeon]